MSAILLGSISTIVDTSELQRAAFNQAFRAHDLDWSWDRADYAEQLQSSGGQDRIAEYAAARGEQVDAAAVHATKSEIFQRDLADADVAPRPGVVQTIRAAKADGIRVALVTTTSPANVSALLDAVKDEIDPADFDLVVDAESVTAPKPDKAAYEFALQTLGERAQDCVAVEDNLGGVQAANDAGISCVAFPNENTAGHDFGDSTTMSDQLDFDALRQVVASV